MRLPSPPAPPATEGQSCMCSSCAGSPADERRIFNRRTANPRAAPGATPPGHPPTAAAKVWMCSPEHIHPVPAPVPAPRTPYPVPVPAAMALALVWSPIAAPAWTPPPRPQGPATAVWPLRGDQVPRVRPEPQQDARNGTRDPAPRTGCRVQRTGYRMRARPPSSEPGIRRSAQPPQGPQLPRDLPRGVPSHRRTRMPPLRGPCGLRHWNP